MPARRHRVAVVAAATWLAFATLAYGQNAGGDQANLRSIADVLEAATNLPQILARNTTPEDDAQLREDMEIERRRLLEILRNNGYLAAEIALEWPGLAQAKASSIRVRVDPGALHVLGTINVATTAPIPGTVMNELGTSIAPLVGDIVSAAALNNLSSRLLWKLGQHGYPFAKVEHLDVTLEPGSLSARVAVGIETGAVSRFVEADLGSTNPQLQREVLDLLPFAVGDIYSADAVATLREALAALAGVTGTRVDVVPAGEDGFSLNLRVERARQSPTSTFGSSLGFGLLIASVGALAARQTAVSANAGRPTVRSLTVAAGGLLLLSGCLLALRVLSFT